MIKDWKNKFLKIALKYRSSIEMKIEKYKPMMQDFIYLNSKRIDALALIFTFGVVFCFTTFINALTVFAFHMFFSGVVAVFLYEKLGIDYIQFEKYRPDINEVKRKRVIAFSISCVICGLFFSIFFSKFNIIQFVMRL